MAQSRCRRELPERNVYKTSLIYCFTSATDTVWIIQISGGLLDTGDFCPPVIARAIEEAMAYGSLDVS